MKPQTNDDESRIDRILSLRSRRFTLEQIAIAVGISRLEVHRVLERSKVPAK